MIEHSMAIEKRGILAKAYIEQDKETFNSDQDCFDKARIARSQRRLRKIQGAQRGKKW